MSKILTQGEVKKIILEVLNNYVILDKSKDNTVDKKEICSLIVNKIKKATN